MNQFLLHLLVKTVSPAVCGRRVGVIRVLPPVVSIEFAGDSDSRYGVVILSAPGPFFYFDSVDPLGGLGEEVLRRIRGFPVTHVEVPGGDRAVRFALSAPRDRVAMSVTLFGPRAKIRVEGRETIIESLDAAEAGAPLRIVEARQGTSLAVVDAAGLDGILASEDRPDRKVPGLTNELLGCFSLPGGGVDAPGLLAFRDGLVDGRSSFLLGTRGRAGVVSPLPAADLQAARSETLTLAHGPFTNVEQACKTVGMSILLSLRDQIADRHGAPLKRRLSSRKRLLSTLKEERRNADSHVALRREANTLAAYQSRIPLGASEVSLPDPYGEGDILIRLDPATPVREQVKKRFRRASKLERSRGVIEKRILTIADEVRRLDQDLTGAYEQPLLADTLRGIEAALRRWGVSRVSARADRLESGPRQLRRFDLDAHWYVLVGRSDRENDEITFRIASPDDIWLHAQQVPGSHVVLKSQGAPGNPPDRILETAAGIAAHFSKARRASVVPVVFTRRKYVRKFKGSKPGQVVCEREKTIFAAPRLPESVDDSA